MGGVLWGIAVERYGDGIPNLLVESCEKNKALQNPELLKRLAVFCTRVDCRYAHDHFPLLYLIYGSGEDCWLVFPEGWNVSLYRFSFEVALSMSENDMVVDIRDGAPGFGIDSW